MICPQCNKANTMTLSNGLGFCFECHFEWNPEELTALPALAAEPFAMATVEEVFGPPLGTPERDAYDATQDFTREVTALTAETNAKADFELIALVGQLATLEGGQEAMVVGVPDDDHLEVMTASGESLTVGFADVERITPIPPFAEPIEATTTGDQAQEATP